MLHDYGMITLAMALGAVGWIVFLLPNEITTGGIPGIASVLYWGLGVPVSATYFMVNALLLTLSVRVLGWKFILKTVYAVAVFTAFTTFLQHYAAQTHLLADQKFMALIVGGAFMGTSVGLGLSSGGSTGGSDVIAAMVHKYRDISLGRIILICDLCIITSSYLVLHDWEKVLYGYVLLFISAFCVDQVVNSTRRSVQFFIISERYETIGKAINRVADRGCTVFDGHGFFSGKTVQALFVIAKKSESNTIFRLIEDIDPGAFVSQSAVIGVYGLGFDRFKKQNKKRLARTSMLINEALKDDNNIAPKA